jgi:hypothetical protein
MHSRKRTSYPGKSPRADSGSGGVLQEADLDLWVDFGSSMAIGRLCEDFDDRDEDTSWLSKRKNKWHVSRPVFFNDHVWQKNRNRKTRGFQNGKASGAIRAEGSVQGVVGPLQSPAKIPRDGLAGWFVSVQLEPRRA